MLTITPHMLTITTITTQMLTITLEGETRTIFVAHCHHTHAHYQTASAWPRTSPVAPLPSGSHDTHRQSFAISPIEESELSFDLTEHVSHAPGLFFENSGALVDLGGSKQHFKTAVERARN